MKSHWRFRNLEAGLVVKRQEAICFLLALARSGRCPVKPPGHYTQRHEG